MRAIVDADTLGELDGGAARAIINAAIRDAIADLDDRACHDGKPRKVEIVLTFTQLDNNQVDARCEAIAKVPRRRTATTIGEIRRQEGRIGLLFSVHAPEDPRQSTLDEHAH